MERKYSVEWEDPQGMGFWLRGIKPDGSFYGELMYAYGDRQRRAGTTVEGQLPPEVWTVCRGMIEVISRVRYAPDTQWSGQLACWTEELSAREIMFRYCLGDEARSDAAKQFLLLKRVLDGQLHDQCQQLIAFSRKTHNRVSGSD